MIIGRTPTLQLFSPVEPQYRDWSEWTPCNAPCGTQGTRTRRRRCFYYDNRPAPLAVCNGSFQEEEPCNRRSCGNGGGKSFAVSIFKKLQFLF